jgi:His/Glu/Gln/Arg/opine family amino acid ABC transporter permease subunit
MDWTVVSESLPVLLTGLLYTVQISVLSILLGLILGWTFGLFSVSNSPPLKWVTKIYVELIRGTPLLVQILLIYFGLTSLGITLSAFWAGVIALGLNSGAFQAEIVRAGIQSVDVGQTEAAKAIGLSHRQSLMYLLVPQAVRRVIPPLTNELMSLIKGSSLLSAIGFAELTHQGQLVIARTFAPFEIYIAISLLYLVVILLLSRLSALLERWIPHY